MSATRSGIARLLVLSALLGPASASAQGISKAGQVPPNPGSSVYNGYGNYWYPTGYPYPSIGGPGYVQYGPGGAAGYYFSAPGTSRPAQALTSTNMGGVAKAITPRAVPSRDAGSASKPVAPARRKSR